MKLPYYYKLSAKSLHSATELKALLSQHTLTGQGASAKDQLLLAQARQQAAPAKPAALYSSTLAPAGFALFRTVPEWDYQPQGRAVCVGRFYAYGTGCRVELRCKAPLFIRLFMAVWGAGAMLGIVSIFFGSLSQGKYQDALITPLAMSPFPVGFWLLHKLTFKNEADRAVLFLRGLGFLGK